MERWKPVMGQGFIFILKCWDKGCPGSMKAQSREEEEQQTSSAQINYGTDFQTFKSCNTEAWGTDESLRATKDPVGILD